MSTPEQNARAWAKLMGDLQGILLTTQRQATAMADTADAIETDTGHVPDMRKDDWEAVTWAARRLREDLGTIRPPEVPLDPERGQSTILDAIAQVNAETNGNAQAALAEDLGFKPPTYAQVPKGKRRLAW